MLRFTRAVEHPLNHHQEEQQEQQIDLAGAEVV